MIYLLYGKEDYLINEKINEIVNDNNILSYNIEKYTLDNNLRSIIDSANTISLFLETKLIIVDDSYIFTGSNKKCDDINVLNDYLDNINNNTIIIFKTNNEKLDSRKKIVSKIKNIGQIIEFNSIVNLNTKIKELFNDYKIDNNLVTYFIKRVGDNLDLNSNEINKIKIYKDKDLLINKDDIDNLTTKNINTDIFNLLDNILNKNKESALESLTEMIKRGEEPVKIIIMLSNQFRLIYQVKELYKKGYREYDIADIIDQKPYTIKKASERIKNYSEKELINYIDKLAELDIKIKSGLIDKNIGLELFILNI